MRGGWLALLVLCLCQTPALAEPPIQIKQPSVTVVMSKDSEPYLEYANALRDILLNSGITLNITDPDKPLPNSGLVIAVGMKAATAVAPSNAPAVLNVLIPKAGYEKLLDDFPQRGSSHAYAAIFLDQPTHRQLHLISAVFPGKHRIGVLYSSPPEDIAQLRREMSAHGLSLQEQAVSSTLPLAEALRELLQKSEVLLALPDAAIYNSSTIRNVLLTTYRSGIPLVGFSPAYAKAGAVCALFSSPAQIAMQSAAIIRRFEETQTLPTAQYPQEFEVLVNEQVARSLGVHTKNPPVLHDEIDASERNGP